MKTDREQSNPGNFSRAFARQCFLYNVFLVTYELRVPQPLTYDYHQWANGSVWRRPHVKLLHFPPWIFLYFSSWTLILSPLPVSLMSLSFSLSIGPYHSHASPRHSSSFSQLLSPRNPEAAAPTFEPQLLLYYLWTCHLTMTLFLFRIPASTCFLHFAVSHHHHCSCLSPVHFISWHFH